MAVAPCMTEDSGRTPGLTGQAERGKRIRRDTSCIMQGRRGLRRNTLVPPAGNAASLRPLNIESAFFHLSYCLL